MTTLAHNRTFLSLLLVVLQLAFLPRVGGCGGDALSGTGCCCETPAADEPVDGVGDGMGFGIGCGDAVGSRSCCSDQGSAGKPTEQPDAPAQRDGKRVCGCAPPTSTVAAWTTRSGEEERRTETDPVAQPTTHSASAPDFPAATYTARILPEAAPRPPTGPPLYLAKQVLLI
jgi:hypothetical protein